MNKILALLKPWQWITLGVAGCFLGFALLCSGGFPIHKEIPGLTWATVHSPHQETTEKGMGIKEVHSKIAVAMRAASIKVHDNDKGRIKTALDASGVRATSCKKLLVGTGVCHGGDNQAVADALTAYLKDKIGVTDFPLDEASPKDPTKTGRELVCSVYDTIALECDKLSK